MVRCDRCDGYVSRDYARVFGDNEGLVGNCPNCRAGWDDGEDEPEESPDRKLRFRMSEFETDESEADEATTPESAGAKTGRFGRVGKAVSGLF
ncbi:MAG: hypothetical protein QXG03_03900 [Halalkalicoccus sp.]